MSALTLFAASIILAGQNPSKAPSRVDEIWDHVDTRVSRQIDLWFKDGDFPKSIQMLYFEVGFHPQDEDALTNLGFLLESTEQYPEALEAYAQFVKDNPQNPDAKFPAANLYYKQKNYKKTVEILEPTLGKGEPHPNSYRIVAKAYERMGKFKDAIRIWEKQLVKFPNDAPAKANIARVKAKIAAGTK